MYHVPGIIPLQPTTFIGREQEIGRLCTLLQRSEVRLLTLTGPAGVGKTRLGLQVAAQLSSQFPDGVFFVPLASVTQPEQVITTILQTLSIDGAGTLPPLASLEATLKEKQLLLLLDNFEQVVEAAPALTTLLSVCSGLKLLVTSRIILRLQAEWEFVVTPLSIPLSADALDPTHLMEYKAIALFVERAQAVKIDFQLTPAVAPAIVAICTRLDGLPLAIELAAARIKYFSPSQLLTQLSNVFALLAHGPQDLPARQRTLRGAIAWSYQLLSQSEQQLFRRLAVFVESFDEEAVTAVCTAVSPCAFSILDGMLSLVDKSLLWPLQHDELAPRFRMLQLLREFSLECLEQAKETEAAREAHANYYLALAEQSFSHHSPIRKQWHDRLEREHTNLQAALTFLLERAQQERQGGKCEQHAEQALRLCLFLSEFWSGRGYFREARNYFEQALAYRTSVAREVQAGALYQLSLIEITQDDYRAAEMHLAESLALYEALDNKKGKAACLTGFARLALIRCEYEAVRSHVVEITSLCQEIGEHSYQALVLLFSARASILQGLYQEARLLLQESLQVYQAANDFCALLPQAHLARLLFLADQDHAQAMRLAEQALQGWQEIGEPEQSATLLVLLGLLHLHRGEVVRAEALLNQSLEIVEGTRDRAVQAQVLIGLAHVRLQEHDPENASQLCRQSVTLLQETGSRQILPGALEVWGFALALSQKYVQAVQLWGAASMQRETFAIKRPPVERPMYERWIAEVRAQFDEKSWTKIFAQGKDMTLTDILALDLSAVYDNKIPHRQEPPDTASPLPSGLTEREAEVLRLLAQGLTNAQIADALVISPRTVTTHLTSIYGKIAVSSRSAATRYAIESRLI